MVKFNFKIDKNSNFFMILHQKSKNQHAFTNFNFENVNNLTSFDRKNIRDFVRGLFSLNKLLEKSPILKEIYHGQQKIWSDYWYTNKSELEQSLVKIEQMFSLVDKSIFERLSIFFENKLQKKINIIICMGNEEEFGTGNGFNPDTTIQFLRNFKNANNCNLEHDLAVIIHEIVHLFQGDFDKENAELREEVARCFAPRGLIFNIDKVSEKRKSSMIFKEVSEAFNNGLTYSAIHPHLHDKGGNFNGK